MAAYKTPADIEARRHAAAALNDQLGVKVALPSGPVSTLRGRGLLLSAPHEAEQIRDGKVKVAEAGTGALAFALARAVGASAICTLPGQTGDPNWDAGHPYLEAALNLEPTLALDVHMMRPRGFEVCLGLGPCRASLPAAWQLVADNLLDAGLRVSLNYPFAAGPQTVTGKLQAAGVPAIQVELSFECFDAAKDEFWAARSALAWAVRELSSL